MAGGEILQLQKEATHGRIIFSVAVLFCVGTSMGSNYVYGGLTVEQHLEQDVPSEKRYFLALTQEEVSWYLSLVPIVQMLGIMAGYPSGEWLGRKKVLILTCLFSILGYLIMLLSDNFWQLILGRCINSFSIGFGSMMPFALVSEISTIKARAPASVVANLSFSFGGLLSFMFTYIFPLSYLIYLSILLSLTFLFLSPLLPESPQFLARHGQLDEARRVYARLRGPAYRGVEEEIAEVLALSAVQEKKPEVRWMSRWRERTFLEPLGILICLFFFLSVNGIDCPLFFYGPKMFAEFG